MPTFGYSSRMLTGRTGATDPLIAAAVTIALLISGLSGNQPATGQAWIGYLVLASGGGGLLALRRAPVLVLVVTGLCALASLATGFGVPALAFLIAVYGAVREGRRIAAVAGSVVMLGAIPLVILAVSPASSMEAALMQSRNVLPLAWLVAAGAAGEALHQAVLRAEQAEQSREEAARRSANEERLHIARELHDSLTHQISVIKIQAGAAVHLARTHRVPAPDHLLAIQHASREAMRELRSTLGALRGDKAIPPGGLDQLQELVQTIRMGGVEASLTIDGYPVGVPSTVDRAGYRIVQEALTNVARHAAATSVTIRVEYHADAVVVRVDDDGWAAANTSPASGHGLRGMRERVNALGGQLQAGSCSEGGFTVRAELPLEPAP